MVEEGLEKRMSRLSPSDASRCYPFLLGASAAWLHAPSSPTRASIGVVLYPGLARDGRWTHRHLRVFAEQLAAAGHLVIRFDYPAFGDSAGDASDDDVLPAWISTGRAAADKLLALGAERIAFGGFRLGATIAALSAMSGDILMLLSPVISGRSWISRLSLLSGHWQAEGQARAGGGLDADGVILSAATCASLSKVDLNQTPERLPTTILATSGRAGEQLAANLADRCDGFEHIDFPGYKEAFEDALLNEAPDALFAALIQRLAAWSSPVSNGPIPAPAPPELTGEGWEEAFVALRPAGWSTELYGNLARPLAGVTSASRGLIFLNTGGDPRSGVGRFSVQASRRLAAAGHVCLRFDFSGLGDSPEPEGVRRVHAYETPRLAEIEAALRRVAAEGVTDISLFGVSAGAFHAFHTALTHSALKGAFCVSQVEYIWRPGAKVLVSGNGWRLSTRHYLTGALRASSWKRVLTGEAPLSRVTKDLVVNFAASWASGGVRREKRNLLRGLTKASSRGVRIHFVVGTRDPALGALETLFGLGGRLLTRSKGMTVMINEDIDHGLVYKNSRDIAFHELCRWLDPANTHLGSVLD